MHTFGHQLNPEAPIKVAPFTPPIFGHQHIGNFEVYSYPGPATYLLAAYGLVLGVTLWLSVRRERRAAVAAGRLAAA